MPNIYHSLIKNKYTQDICVFFTYLGLTKTNPVLLFQRKEFENMYMSKWGGGENVGI